MGTEVLLVLRLNQSRDRIKLIIENKNGINLLFSSVFFNDLYYLHFDPAQNEKIRKKEMRRKLKFHFFKSYEHIKQLIFAIVLKTEFKMECDHAQK